MSKSNVPIYPQPWGHLSMGLHGQMHSYGKGESSMNHEYLHFLSTSTLKTTLTAWLLWAQCWACWRAADEQNLVLKNTTCLFSPRPGEDSKHVFCTTGMLGVISEVECFFVAWWKMHMKSKHLACFICCTFKLGYMDIQVFKAEELALARKSKNMHRLIGMQVLNPQEI